MMHNKGKILLIILLMMVGGYYFSHSGIFIKSFSTPLYGEKGEDGFYKISFPEEKIFYYRPWSGGEFPFQTYRMQIDYPLNLDIETFEQIGRFYAKDKNNVYYVDLISRRTRIIPGMSPSLVEVINNYQIKDKNNFAIKGVIKDGLDPDNYRILTQDLLVSGENIFFDKFDISSKRNGSFVLSRDNTSLFCEPYYKGESTRERECKITESGKDEVVKINASELEFIKGNSNSIYLKDDVYVYYFDAYECGSRSGTCFFQVVEGASPDTFEKESGFYKEGCLFLTTDGEGKQTQQRVTHRTNHYIDQGRCYYWGK